MEDNVQGNEGKLVFKEDRRNELRDSFKGRLILPLAKAFEFNQTQHSWSLMMGGVNVGEIELMFDFTNQDMISAHEMFISQISNKVIDNFNDQKRKFDCNDGELYKGEKVIIFIPPHHFLSPCVQESCWVPAVGGKCKIVSYLASIGC